MTESLHATNATLVANNFILEHSTSLTNGVHLLTLGGSKIYQVGRDTRTHSLFVFISSCKAEAVCEKSDEAHRKMLRQIRDKFDPSERPFIPRRFRSIEEYQASLKPIEIEERDRVIRIENNRPVYNIHPIWNFKEDPYFTLLIRIPEFWDFFSKQSEYVECLLGIVKEVPKLPHLRIVEERSGQWILEKIGFREILTTNMRKLFGDNVNNEIDFQDFQHFSPELLFEVESFDNKILPKNFIKVRDNETSTASNTEPLSEINDYKVKAWIDTNGNYYETMVDKSLQTEASNSLNKAIQGKRFISHPKEKQFKLGGNPSSDPAYILYTREEIKITYYDINRNSNDLIHEGVYVKSQKVSKLFLFREPVSCKQSNLESYKDFPVLVQRKMDGNRIVVICALTTQLQTANAVGSNANGEEIKYSTHSIRYYSRSGGLQSKKFNKQFDEDIKIFISQFPEINNLMLDCECYSHGVIHAEIAGLCNAIEAKPGFEKLQLFVLSVIDLDNLEEFEERKKKHFRTPYTFSERITPQRETERIKVNPTFLANDTETLYSMMRDSVENGFEGLVLYPPNNHYTFHLDRLFKIKKIYDGECEAIGFKESETDPGAIASVQVKAKPYLSIRFHGSHLGIRFSPPKCLEGEVIFYVSASLEKEYKQGSMRSPRFLNCIGKRFTIICDSFSDDGVPIHARFKSQFSPENERLE